MQVVQVDKFHANLQPANTLLGDCIVWNQQETKIMYIANVKEEKPASFLDSNLEDAASLAKALKFSQLRQDLCSNLPHCWSLKIFVYDLATQQLAQLLIDDQLIPCNA